MIVEEGEGGGGVTVRGGGMDREVEGDVGAGVWNLRELGWETVFTNGGLELLIEFGDVLVLVAAGRW